MQSLLQGYRPYLLLTLLWAFVALPGLTSMPVMDRDEARFVQATRQMAESNDYVVVRFQDELRAKKPVGIYWLQSAMVDAFSHPAKTDAWPYRLPSALGMLMAVLMTFRLGLVLFDRRIALLAGGLLATSLMAAVEAHLAKTDGVLLGLTSVVMGCFGLIYLAGKGGPKAPSWAALALWLALGCALLVKGPVTLMILLLTMITLGIADRTVVFLHGLRPVMGLLLCGAIVGPWLAAVTSATKGAFVQKAVAEDLLPKLLGAQESHGAAPGFYVAIVLVTLFPASLFLFPALVRAWRERSLPGIRYALAWLVPSWIVFELLPTKLPHYTLPLYPALALIIATCLFAVRDGTYQRLAALPAMLWYGLWSLVALALAGGFIALPILYGDGWSLWSIPAAAGVLLALGWGWLNLLRHRFLNAAAAVMAGAVLTYASTFGGLINTLQDLWVSERVAARIEAMAPGAAVASAGYHEPSLVFLLGTHTLLTDGEGAAHLLAEKPGSAAVVEAHQLDGFRAGITTAGLAPRLIEGEVVRGFNYSRGKPVEMHLFTLTSQP
ncbi:ArnT family glycosyltransferase [Insolitispirillum peregrinum]|uniref:4-amino-4-deoxy-L-arabinose transferase n=1 Tax=Insolitispirillum peregrinum TaxID=80876 RepID=A0A1N7JHD9_9PROT|nr:glycosyltransferase family 39 protein [Insolitispirillum peregrinum]SIS48773.1 4-amino-4-deoxy-L-arabinose transferase [Insolitispirillum peregrinum]